jgi:hypothetical protein
MRIDCDFPGGNIIVERIAGDSVQLRQDLRDTNGDWFYWYFRVRDAEGKTVRFQFAGSNVIGVRGPCVSVDGGQTWDWLGAESVSDQSFAYTFPQHAVDARFSIGIPYLQSNLDAFLQQHSGNASLVQSVLCKTAKGRAVEFLRTGRIDGACKRRLLLTCRHHSCEASASFALEGLLAATLQPDTLGAWYRENVEVLAVPFVDKDGVEDGDQGKNRKPHDHNRDYAGESLYPTVRALRNLAPEWADGRPLAFIDMHCPWIRGGSNEIIYFVGSASAPHWEQTLKLSDILERIQRGPLKFNPKDNMPFGTEWNTYDGPQKTSQRWAQELPGATFAASLEFPYANAAGGIVTAHSARAFGRDLASALQQYLSA